MPLCEPAAKEVRSRSVDADRPTASSVGLSIAARLLTAELILALDSAAMHAFDVRQLAATSVAIFARIRSDSGVMLIVPPISLAVAGA